MRKPLALLIAVALLPLAACAPTIREHFGKNALGRASFEMECPQEKIEIQGLNQDLGEYIAAGSTVGVRGCGKKAVYVLTNGAIWVMNSAGEDGGLATPGKAAEK